MSRNPGFIPDFRPSAANMRPAGHRPTRADLRDTASRLRTQAEALTAGGDPRGAQACLRVACRLERRLPRGGAR